MRILYFLLFVLLMFACEEKTDRPDVMQKYMMMAEHHPDSTLNICEKKLKAAPVNSKEGVAAAFVAAKILNAKAANKAAAEKIKQVLHANALDGHDLIEAYRLASIIYYEIADYESALDISLQLLKMAEQNQNQPLKTETYIHIFRIYFTDQEHDQALAYLKLAKTAAYESKDTSLICKALMRDGSYWGEKMQYSKAIASFSKVSDLAQKSDNQNLLTISRSNMAMCYMYSGNPNQAISIIRTSLSKFQKDSAYLNITRTYRNLGWAMHLSGQSDSAEIYLTKGELLAEKKNFRHMLGNINSTKAQMYKENGDFEKSLNHFYRYTQIKDSLLLEEKALGLAKLKEEFEQDKRVIKVEAREKRIRIWYIYAFSVLLLGMGIVFVLIRNRIRLRVRNAEDRAKKIEWELKLKREEIFDFSMRLKEKHRIMLDLQQELQMTKNNGENCYNRMSQALKSHLTSEDARLLLEEKVEKGNKEFLDLIRERFPDLTKDELYLIGLLKLRFSSKQIAEIFETTEKAIEGRRYRLRKKIGAPKQMDLLEFFTFKSAGKSQE